MPPAARTIVYSPYSADLVSDVDPFVIYSNADRTVVVQTLTNGVKNLDDNWEFEATLNDGTYYTSATVTYMDNSVEVDDDDIITLIVPSAPRWSYTFCPKLGGRTYDPTSNDGQVVSLTLVDPQTGTTIMQIGSPKRTGFGSYLFEIPFSVPEGIYFGEVVWRPTAYETTYVESNLIVELPERKNNLIKPWVTLQEVYLYNPELRTIDPRIVLDSIYSATQALYNLSGKKFRGTQIYSELYSPACLVSRDRMNRRMSTSGSFYGCGCSNEGIFLRRRPAQHIYQVSYNEVGTIISPLLYRLDNMNRLVGRSITHTEVRVTYAAGIDPPQLAKTACIALAGEIALYHAGSDACRLPANVVNVNREGLSFSITDKQDFLDRGLVGIYEVDLFLRSVNPTKTQNRARVLTADQMQARNSSILLDSCVATTQPLTVQTEKDTLFTYLWRYYNTPHLISGYYAIRAFAGTLSLTPYITVEPNGEPGKISITIPSVISDTLSSGDTWYLEAVSIATGEVTRLVTGEVRRL